jgi:hypothetical protein
MAELRKQRQTFGKVLKTSDRKFFGFGIGFGQNFGFGIGFGQNFGFGIGFGQNFGFNTHFGFGIVSG